MHKITFFSYKGGSGRSTTTVNTLPYVAHILNASNESPILLVDMDFDSAGLTYFFNEEDWFKKPETIDSKSMACISNLRYPRRSDPSMSSYFQQINNHSLFCNTVPVGHKIGLSMDQKHCIRFLGVSDDPKKVELLGLTASEAERNIKCFIDTCINFNFKAIIFDSASGDQVSAQASIKHAETIVVCMRPTKQFFTGTQRYLLRKAMGGELVDKNVIFLPTAVPIEATHNIEKASQDIRMLFRFGGFNEVSSSEKNIHFDFASKDNFGIPEIERFKWKEDILYKLNIEKESLNDHELLAIRRYSSLADMLINGLQKK